MNMKKIVTDQRGQELLEYALLLALICLVAVAAVTAAGGTISGLVHKIGGLFR